MRPIDADAITYWAGIVDRNGEWLTRKKTIDELPTLDVAPVKHGAWEKVKYEDDDGYFYLYVHKDCGCKQARERNYCPNCGAKMDGGKVDDKR